MKKFTLLIITMILLIATNLSAEDRQFYFIGKETRLGSLSSMASSQNAIYLRWDLIEGSMPTDIASITLIRVDDDKNSTLLSVTSDEIMEDINISTMYQEPSSQRRLFELITSISKSDDAVCSAANVANIGEKVKACAENDIWSFLASRVDFDVARARYRAYLDTTYNKSASSVEYLLIGKDALNKESIILGKASVNLKDGSEVLAAQDIVQIRTSKCNDNRYGLDDARVALNWKNGGVNTTEFFANGLMISGYDIYYSTLTSNAFKAIQAPSDIDLASIVVAKKHNSEGGFDLSENNLMKANETLITIGAQDANDSTQLYIETKDELALRGFLPGEKRFYFIVPRDFTGNYGPTTFYEVEIPDILPPVAPINPRVVEKDAKASLIWNAVNFQNYASYHQNDMKVCSTETILQNSRVKFVDKDEECSVSSGVILNFNVEKYYIYRFSSAAEAAGFEDLDLDGHNDALESDAQKCNSELLSDGKNYLVGTVEHTNNKTLSYQDSDLLKGRVYWYRIVSATANDIISTQTAPIRAFIPKRELLAAPQVNARYYVSKITTPINEIQDKTMVIDNLSETTKVRLLIKSNSYELPLSEGRANLSAAMQELHFNSTDTSGTGTISFLNGDEVFASRSFYLSTMFNFDIHKDDFEEYATIRNTKRYFDIDKEQQKVSDGVSVEGGCVEVTFDDEFLEGLSGNGCIETTIAIGNRRYQRSVDCNITQKKEICETSLNGDMVSIGFSKIMHNGLYSSSSYLNFVPTMDLRAPHKPSLVAIVFDKAGQKASVGIRPQIEKVTGTMLSMYKKDEPERSFMQTVTHIGKNNVDEEINAIIEDLGLIVDADIWCVKAKTIGLNGKTSEWSTALCQRVLPLTEEMDNLEWPALGKVSLNEERLPLVFDEDTQRVQITIAAPTVEVETEVGAKVEPGEYTSVIAKDEIDAAKELNVGFYKNEELIESVRISKSVDNNFYLPSKSAQIDSSEMARSIDSIVLEFITREDKALFESPIVLKGENVLAMNASQLEVNERVTLENQSTTNECDLIESINAFNRDYDYVVYRQSIDEESQSNFVQITPLMQESTCNKVSDTLEMSNNITISSDGTQRVVSVVDRYPYIVGKTYKYVIVFFGKDSGEPVSYTLTSPESIRID